MTRKILVIDDEPIFVEAIKEVLMKRNFQVLTAKDGREGFEKVESDRPDLIALDVKMPRMNGYEFMRALNARKVIDKREEIPVIVMSAKEEMREAFRLQGVKEYLVKPLEFSDLVRKIEDCLKSND